jgi:hypothetical protein
MIKINPSTLPSANPFQKGYRKGIGKIAIVMLLDPANGSTMVVFVFELFTLLST